MAFGTVETTLLNLSQGDLKTPERLFLFVGESATASNAGVPVSVGVESNFATLFGAGDLADQLSAAKSNAESNNWCAWVLPLTSVQMATQTDFIMSALNKPSDLNVEAIVLCKAVATKSEVEALQVLADNISSTFGKYVQIICAVGGIDAETETWATYLTRITALQAGVVAENVCLVPQLASNCLGVVCGRLCNPAVTIADTPMRVATGALNGLSEIPEDTDGQAITLANLKAMETVRFCVPQYYTSFDGWYWADMRTLDAEGGDFQVYENIRVTQACSRRLRILAIRKIADRSLNNTARSISIHETYFASVLREFSKSTTIGEMEFPGIVMSPEAGDVSIQWQDRYNVTIVFMARTYTCPKGIKLMIGLTLPVID